MLSTSTSFPRPTWFAHLVARHVDLRHDRQSLQKIRPHDLWGKTKTGGLHSLWGSYPRLQIGILGIVSGVFGAYRREAVERLGGWDVGPGEDGDMTLRLRKAGYQIVFAPYAQCYTNLLRSFRRLLRQRRRWDWAVVTFECRKHIDLANVFSPNFRLNNLCMLIERWLYNILFQFLFWGYLAWCLLHTHEHTGNQFFLYYLFYFRDSFVPRHVREATWRW